jgi:rsbT co-antagonist protein RsbR
MNEHAARVEFVETISEELREQLCLREGLRGELNRLADELCGRIDGGPLAQEQGLLRTELDDAIVQKLCISINFLLDTVRRSTAQTESKQLQLSEKLQTIAEQQARIESMSTPLLRMRDDVLVLPLVGLLDESRCAQIREALLTEIAARHVRYALLDITGVALVDERTAGFLIRIARSVELLGARCVLSGVRPSVAATLVTLDSPGMDLSRLIVARDLEQGLHLCR